MSEYKEMVVIFVDLLGTKNNTKFEDKLFIHQIFHGEAKMSETRNLDHVIYDRKVFSFSDCAYFFYHYKDGIEDSRKNNMKLIQTAMFNTSLSLLRILNAGYLVRGGISFGLAYFDELGFFGPAVEEAYKLESEDAQYPMILLNQKLGKEFYEWDTSQIDMNFVNEIMTSVPLLIEKEKDTGKYFLNIFYQVEAFGSTLQLETEKVDIEIIKQNLNTTISKDKLLYKENVRVCSKLEWMEKYLELKHSQLRDGVVGFGEIYN